MKLSIIIPCYNVENFVQKCANSILVQKGFDCELIFVNDGSKDNTLHVLENLAIKDNRIKVINQENQGLSGARNTGIENAKGDYIMFVDADDWLESNAFDIISKNLQLENRILFLNNRKDIFEIMKTVDYNVLSSNFEGLSLSAIESLASGKPFIASDVSGLNFIKIRDCYFLKEMKQN